MILVLTLALSDTSGVLDPVILASAVLAVLDTTGIVDAVMIA